VSTASVNKLENLFLSEKEEDKNEPIVESLAKVQATPTKQLSISEMLKKYLGDTTKQ